jgi:hypothetical protein
MVMIMGTSICHMVLGDAEHVVPGMCGCVKNGIVPGLFGYEAGQSCVGDHFTWSVENCVPASYESEARKRNIDIHLLLEEKAAKLKPGESGLLALDWWNGNRSVLVDVELTGLLLGATLATKPEEIYRALIEAIAYVTRVIVDTFQQNSVPIRELVACGGLPEKNKLLMQIYAALLVAIGVDRTGRRHVLGVSISLGEHKIHWRTFLQSLVHRGLQGVQLITSDDHSGLKAARLAVFGGIPWQRCQFHLQQNASQHVPRQSMKTEVATDLRMIFNAPNRTTADAYLAQVVQKYAKTASKLADWMEKNVPEGLTVFGFPTSHQRKLRTTNGLERLNREIHRRTGVVGIFPNEAACLRLSSAILMEFDDEWQIGRIYLTFQEESALPSP